MGESLAMLPWYPGDFMRSTRGWPVTAKGVYRELLDAQWDMGGLPVAPEQLREMIGATRSEWSKSWPFCEQKFPVCVDGLRRNTVLEHHRDKTQKLRESRVLGGKAAAAKRWHSDSSANRSANSSAIAERWHPSPSPSPTEESLRSSSSLLQTFSPSVGGGAGEKTIEKNRSGCPVKLPDLRVSK